MGGGLGASEPRRLGCGWGLRGACEGQASPVEVSANVIVCILNKSFPASQVISSV